MKLKNDFSVNHFSQSEGNHDVIQFKERPYQVNTNRDRHPLNPSCFSYFSWTANYQRHSHSTSLIVIKYLNTCYFSSETLFSVTNLTRASLLLLLSIFSLHFNNNVH